ncbi:MAG: hypothetical protein WAZ18_05820 [Alphaproteobacteria bacterium]
MKTPKILSAETLLEGIKPPPYRSWFSKIVGKVHHVRLDTKSQHPLSVFTNHLGQTLGYEHPIHLSVASIAEHIAGFYPNTSPVKTSPSKIYISYGFLKDFPEDTQVLIAQFIAQMLLIQEEKPNKTSNSAHIQSLADAHAASIYGVEKVMAMLEHTLPPGDSSYIPRIQALGLIQHAEKVQARNTNPHTR